MTLDTRDCTRCGLPAPLRDLVHIPQVGYVHDYSWCDNGQSIDAAAWCGVCHQEGIGCSCDADPPDVDERTVVARWSRSTALTFIADTPGRDVWRLMADVKDRYPSADVRHTLRDIDTGAPLDVVACPVPHPATRVDIVRDDQAAATIARCVRRWRGGDTDEWHVSIG